jgi:hypothetical protein
VVAALKEQRPAQESNVLEGAQVLHFQVQLVRLSANRSSRYGPSERIAGPTLRASSAKSHLIASTGRFASRSLRVAVDHICGV